MACFLSGYLLGLSAADKDVYLNKIKKCEGYDPYEVPMSSFNQDTNVLPKVTHADIVNYLVFTTQSVTLEQAKAFKSLEAHNYFTSGWVQPDTKLLRLPSGNVVLIGKVNHSQSFSEPMLKVWVLAKADGEIITAHCNCKAGCGSVCSHVGAVLFQVDAVVRLEDSRTCTDRLNTWLPPHIKQVPYLPIKDVDFTSARAKKKKFDCVIENNNNDLNAIISKPRNKLKPEAPSDAQIEAFYAEIATANPNAVCLSLNKKYDSFIPKPVKLLGEYKLFADYFNQDNLSLSWDRLLDHCEDVFMNLKISKETAAEIEKSTREQSKSRLWFKVKSGLVTASHMKGVCQTDKSNPSLSLIRAVCYPTKGFTNAAMSWGCEHEKTALKEYCQTMNKTHQNFHCANSGLHINTEYPHIGATPDGLVSCQCCENGACEVKCPFCACDSSVDEYVNMKQSCLQDVDGIIKLNRQHSYYYQVQTQIFVCNVPYCDLIIWTSKDLHTERILPDLDFWQKCVDAATQFFKTAILPEVTAKWFTRERISAEFNNVLLPRTAESETPNNSAQEVENYCFCGKGEFGNMVGCDNTNCKRMWFHFQCLKISEPPRSKKWYCPECRVLPKFKKIKRGKEN